MRKLWRLIHLGSTAIMIFVVCIEQLATKSPICRNDSENEDVGASKIIHQKTSKSRGRYKRKKRTLPPVLQGLMGEANLRFARGDIELAAQICMEIIRQVVYPTLRL